MLAREERVVTHSRNIAGEGGCSRGPAKVELESHPLFFPLIQSPVSFFSFCPSQPTAAASGCILGCTCLQPDHQVRDRQLEQGETVLAAAVTVDGCFLNAVILVLELLTL